MDDANGTPATPATPATATPSPPAPPASLFRRLRIKSRQVMLLDALDEHRNLRRAAAAIHTTQPAATALLQQLEEGLGVVLFERHARGMEPTVYGEVMIRYARGVLHDFAHAGDEMARWPRAHPGWCASAASWAPRRSCSPRAWRASRPAIRGCAFPCRWTPATC
ncbi:LysR family transcriptional regulator [Polaromonas sp. P1-6]|nr:LysR family transcriptional regulator [Polaromonas sp. P1-6]